MPSPRPIGVFAKTFPGTTADAVLGAAAEAGIRHVQFNLSCVGLPTVPPEIDASVGRFIAVASMHHGVSIAAMSGTCNLADPDASVRAEWVRRLAGLAALCADCGIPVLTLTTGTRHRTDLWAGHPDNTSVEAWHDAEGSLRELLRLTDGLPVALAFEPEGASITRTVDDALRMINSAESDRFRSRLRVVLDVANLIEPADSAQLPRLLRDDVPKLRDRIALLHAKDRAANGDVVPPGEGVIDFAAVFQAAADAGYTGPAIMHGLDADRVPAAREHLQRVASRVAAD